jgi:hypothetical protein
VHHDGYEVGPSLEERSEVVAIVVLPEGIAAGGPAAHSNAVHIELITPIGRDVGGSP